MYSPPINGYNQRKASIWRQNWREETEKRIRCHVTASPLDQIIWVLFGPKLWGGESPDLT